MNIRPRWFDKVPRCTYDCPCLKGRHYNVTHRDCAIDGWKPIGICEPMVRRMRGALWKLERTVDGRGALHDIGWWE